MACHKAATGARRVVLVHGAWADVSSWDKVIPLLLEDGLAVSAVQIPMTSLADDTAAVKRALCSEPNEVILVGHAWGGAVITEAGADDRVVALVYVAGFAPSIGQSVIDLSRDYLMPPGFAHVHVGGDGFLRLSADGMAKCFAPDLAADEVRVMVARQSPIAGACMCEKATVAAWTSKPSWYVVAENDRMIQPSLQRSMARKVGAETTILRTSHAAMLASPKEVAAIILAAAEKAGASPQGEAAARPIEYPLNGSAHSRP
jgi:pimeloyl-ACP methyl ester carboxylesterase